MTPGGTNEDYPRLVFPGDSPDMSNHVQFIQRDSFIYTSGYDDAAGLRLKATGTHVSRRALRQPDALEGPWQRQDKPCSFRVRYVMPQQLMGGDSIGPIPMGASSTHAYSVVVGGYDVMRFHIRRIGPNITDSCNGRMQDCLDKVHWLTGQAFTAVDRCPTRGGQLSELTNETTTLTKEWFCTGPGEEGRYYLALRSAALLDPRGPVPGYLMWDGTTPSSELLVPQQGLAGNQLKEARGYYTLSVYHRAFFEGPLRPGEAREGCVTFGQWRQFTVVTSGATDASLSVAAVDEAGNEPQRAACRSPQCTRGAIGRPRDRRTTSPRTIRPTRSRPRPATLRSRTSTMLQSTWTPTYWRRRWASARVFRDHAEALRPQGRRTARPTGQRATRACRLPCLSRPVAAGTSAASSSAIGCCVRCCPTSS